MKESKFICGACKKKKLQYLIVDFAIEIAPRVKKNKWNNAWLKLWQRIARLKLFEGEGK